jgi:hypothetical protein
VVRGLSSVLPSSAPSFCGGGKMIFNFDVAENDLKNFLKKGDKND